MTSGSGPEIDTLRSAVCLPHLDQCLCFVAVLFANPSPVYSPSLTRLRKRTSGNSIRLVAKGRWCLARGAVWQASAGVLGTGLSRDFSACGCVRLLTSVWHADCISLGLQLSRNQRCGSLAGDGF